VGLVFRGGGPSGKAAEGVEGVGGVTKLFRRRGGSNGWLRR
jgi:hypothetical protein